MTSDSSFFRLLRIGLGTDTIDKLVVPCQFSNTDCQFSIAQGVGAFIYDGLQRAIGNSALSSDAVSRDVKMKLFSHTMQVEKLCKAQYAKATELSSIYAEHGIRTIVLKGIAAGANYPHPNLRPCGDLDCFLMGDYETGNEIAKKIGAEVNFPSYKHSHICYKGLVVENHQFCTAHRGNKQLKRFERLLQDLLREEENTQIGNTAMECPSPLFNALFLSLHAKEHFILEGIALRHLCDWAMLLHKHAGDIDWQRFTAITVEYGLREFADIMTYLAAEYLHVSIPEGYDIVVNDECVIVLQSALLDGIMHEPKGKCVFCDRMSKAIRFKQNDIRLRLFSNTSFVMYVLKQVRGLLFDRNPQI